MIDPDMPAPTITIGEARKRLAKLPLSHRQYVAQCRAYLDATGTHAHNKAMTKYLFRQLVEYGARYATQGELEL